MAEKRRRVVITGLGAVTPLGTDFPGSWLSLIRGESGLGISGRAEAEALPWRITGEVRGFDPLGFMDSRELRRVDRFVRMALGATLEAVKDASLEVDRDTMVLIGSSRGGISGIEDALVGRITGGRSFSAYLMPSTTVSMAASYVSMRLGLFGYGMGISSACASGAIAIGEAFRLISTGYGDVAVAGGAESPICMTCVEGYGRMGVLSKGSDYTASRPFDSERDGFVLSEGASVVILEERQSALNRGARIYAEIRGYSNITSPVSQTAPSLEGEVEVMMRALKEAGACASDVVCVNAHGTSTRAGDRVEAEAIRAVSGGGVAVTANKSMTGHMLAGSGAFEVATTAMGIYSGVVPPTINFEKTDDGEDLKVVTVATPLDAGVSITNSFGFGGINASLVLAGPAYK